VQRKLTLNLPTHHPAAEHLVALPEREKSMRRKTSSRPAQDRHVERVRYCIGTGAHQVAGKPRTGVLCATIVDKLDLSVRGRAPSQVELRVQLETSDSNLGEGEKYRDELANTARVRRQLP
jgi:hypothetical protein